MLTPFHWFAFASIIVVTFAGGALPLLRPERARRARGFPSGEAFAAGIFLALSTTVMLPAGFALLGKAFPDVTYPVGSIVAICGFALLLALEHASTHLKEEAAAEGGDDEVAASDSPTIPLIMTAMIAGPSFLLGAALGISDGTAAVMIWLAIIIHKSSAAFALALRMVRSTMGRWQVLGVFTLFALSTPVGIVVGGDVHDLLGTHAMFIIKGTILSLASGVFLYMATLHELRHTPMIADCGTKKGFALMVAGFVVTALVRWIIGEAHHM
jgi:zinc transporter ZupT